MRGGHGHMPMPRWGFPPASWPPAQGHTEGLPSSPQCAPGLVDRRGCWSTSPHLSHTPVSFILIQSRYATYFPYTVSCHFRRISTAHPCRSEMHLVAVQVAVLRTPLVIGASSTPGISCLQKTVITSVAAVWRPPAVYTLHKDNRMCPRLIVCTLLLALGVGRSSVPLALAGRRRTALPCPPTSSPRSPRWDPGSSRFAGCRKALPLRGSRARHGTSATPWNRP